MMSGAVDAILYTAYHKPSPRFCSPSVAPIHVGRAAASAPLPDMIGDDTGENISERNTAFCELTALYWACKNAPAEKTHIGLMHYRRLLDLTGRQPEGPVEAVVSRLDIAPWLAEVEDHLAGAEEADIVVPRLHHMGRSVASNYHHAHQGQDYDAARDIIAADHPEYLDSFDAVGAQNTVRLANMCLMRRDLFQGYCAWLFDILFKVEALPLDRSHYTTEQCRYLGFLSERLFTSWLHHLAKTDPEIKLREVSILNLSRALVVPYADDARFSGPGEINIALAADDTYLPHAAAMLRSLIDHVDTTRPLNVFLLHDGVGTRRLDALASVIAAHPVAAFHPIDTANAFEDFYRSESRAPSNATYNRFLLFSLLPKVSRLLYLDADVIVLRDIAALFDTEMDGAALAAVPDWIMTRTLTGPIPTIDPNVPDLSTYQRDFLNLSEAQMARYVNAGVLLFDFTAMDDPLATGAALIARAEAGGYLFRDQDILNAHFADSLKVLDGRWNVFNSTANSYDKVPAANRALAMEARKDPWIVHYADRSYKPWTAQMTPRSELYWQALIRTPFYGEVMGQLQRSAAKSAISTFMDRIDGHEETGLVRRAKDEILKRDWLKKPALKLYAQLNKARG